MQSSSNQYILDIVQSSSNQYILVIMQSSSNQYIQVSLSQTINLTTSQDPMDPSLDKALGIFLCQGPKDVEMFSS